MGVWWDLIQARIDEIDLDVSDAALGRRLGVVRQTVTNWRTKPLKALPNPDNMEAVAEFVQKPYEYVLEAALVETGHRGRVAKRKVNPDRTRMIEPLEVKVIPSREHEAPK